VVAAVIGATMALATIALANVAIKVVSQDPYTNADSYHKTEVEPDTISFGNTIVSTFQMGRHTDGGASNLGFGTSTDGGGTWTSGGLPGLTVFSTPPGPYQRATDPAVGYDRKHHQWIIVELDSLTNSGFSGDAVTVSRSSDGLTWGSPITVATATGFQSFDSTWISCDGWPTSPYYGSCYVEFDDNGSGNILHLSVSRDGGQTWHASTVPGGQVVIGGKPVSQPNGHVVVPIDDGFASSAMSYVSTNGGQSYTGPFSISSFQEHGIAGSLRSLNIVSADVDNTGKVYVVWFDCRFRSGCSSNDIVMSTSMDGQSWTPVVRIPIDLTTSTVDHFLPGIAVKPQTGGATAGLALVYWFYKQANCSPCQLYYGEIQSSNGGTAWGSPTQILGPFTVTWYPSTTSGYMVGDYSSVSYVTGGTESVFAAARQSTCQLGANNCKVAMVAPATPLAAPGGRASSRGDRVATHLGLVPRTVLKSAN
jgi:hypothetical protein